MKKTLFILGICLSVAFLYAQNFNQRHSEYLFKDASANVDEVSKVSILGDCAQARLFSVEYSSNCETATLNWLNPTDVLFDNFVNTGSGRPSVRWLWDEMSRSIIADDFDVPPGETWVISEVYGQGFYKTGGDDPHEYECPDYIGVEIYDDNGYDLPGTQIYENANLIPTIGSIGGAFTVIFPEPIVISAPGKYWISYYGAYENEYHDERVFFVFLFDEPRGALFAYLDEPTSPEWSPLSVASTSLSFKIQGTKSTDPVVYNLYRDGQPIATNITETSYEDSGYDTSKKHSYSVVVACPGGGASNYTNANPPLCVPQSVKDNTDATFDIVPNPATSNITVTSTVNINNVDIINFLGQTVLSQQGDGIQANFDISNLNNGVYFVRIATDNGVSVKKFVKQ